MKTIKLFLLLLFISFIICNVTYPNAMFPFPDFYTDSNLLIDNPKLIGTFAYKYYPHKFGQYLLNPLSIINNDLTQNPVIKENELLYEIGIKPLEIECIEKIVIDKPEKQFKLFIYKGKFDTNIIETNYSKSGLIKKDNYSLVIIPDKPIQGAVLFSSNKVVISTYQFLKNSTEDIDKITIESYLSNYKKKSFQSISSDCFFWITYDPGKYPLDGLKQLKFDFLTNLKTVNLSLTKNQDTIRCNTDLYYLDKQKTVEAFNLISHFSLAVNPFLGRFSALKEILSNSQIVNSDNIITISSKISDKQYISLINDILKYEKEKDIPLSDKDKALIQGYVDDIYNTFKTNQNNDEFYSILHPEIHKVLSKDVLNKSVESIIKECGHLITSTNNERSSYLYYNNTWSYDFSDTYPVVYLYTNTKFSLIKDLNVDFTMQFAKDKDKIYLIKLSVYPYHANTTKSFSNISIEIPDGYSYIYSVLPKEILRNNIFLQSVKQFKIFDKDYKKTPADFLDDLLELYGLKRIGINSDKIDKIEKVSIHDDYIKHTLMTYEGSFDVDKIKEAVNKEFARENVYTLIEKKNLIFFPLKSFAYGDDYNNYACVSKNRIVFAPLEFINNNIDKISSISVTDYLKEDKKNVYIQNSKDKFYSITYFPGVGFSNFFKRLGFIFLSNLTSYSFNLSSINTSMNIKTIYSFTDEKYVIEMRNVLANYHHLLFPFINLFPSLKEIIIKSSISEKYNETTYDSIISESQLNDFFVNDIMGIKKSDINIDSIRMDIKDKDKKDIQQIILDFLTSLKSKDYKKVYSNFSKSLKLKYSLEDITIILDNLLKKNEVKDFSLDVLKTISFLDMKNISWSKHFFDSFFIYNYYIDLNKLVPKKYSHFQFRFIKDENKVYLDGFNCMFENEEQYKR